MKAIGAAGDNKESAPSNAVTPKNPPSGGDEGDNTGTRSSNSEQTIKPSDTGVEVEVLGKSVIGSTQIETMLIIMWK